jgi:DNA-binding LacI/PurR family transcriptional regulator
VIASFADETDPTVAAFLRPFNAPIVSMSNTTFRQAVGSAQVNYLVQQGRERSVFAAPERRDVQKLAQARLDGVRQRCLELTLKPPLVQIVPLSRQGAQEAIADLLARQSPPFGVCCYNDEVAFAVIAALSDAGIDIPESAAVIGCDDIPLAQFSNPPLTTISFDTRQLLDLRIKHILAASQGELIQESPPVSLSVIVRKSA